MGLIAALNFPEGISKSKTAIMKLLLLTALAAVALAEPEADAHYGGYGGYYGHGYGYGLHGYGYGHQLQWPTYSAPGFTSTVWGARGKRSAEPSAEPHGYGFYGYHPYAHGLYHPYAYGHHVAHVAAPAVVAPALPALAAAGVGVGGHPGGATSYSHRSPQGLRGKRSAEEVEAVAEEAAAPAAAVAHPYYGGYYGHQLGWASFRAPGFESTLWGGRLGKRSAEADAEPAYGYGYYGSPAYRGYYGHGYYGHGLRGVAGHPSGTSYTFRSPQGLGK